MATDIPINELERVVYNGTDLNALNIGDCKWRKRYNLTVNGYSDLGSGGLDEIEIYRRSMDSASNSPGWTSIFDDDITTVLPILYGDLIEVHGHSRTGYTQPNIYLEDLISRAVCNDAGYAEIDATGDVFLDLTTGEPLPYTLSISSITGVVNQVVTRTSSFASAAENGVLSDGDTIYYDDCLTISARADNAYDSPQIDTPFYVTGDVTTADYITPGGIITSLAPPTFVTASWSNGQLKLTFKNNNSSPFHMLCYIYDENDEMVGEMLTNDTSQPVLSGASVTLTSVTTSAQYCRIEYAALWTKLLDGKFVGTASESEERYIPRYTLSPPSVVSTSFETNYDYDTYRYKYLGYVTIRNNNNVSVYAKTTWTCSSGSIVRLGSDTLSIPAGAAHTLGCNTTDTGATVTVYFAPTIANTYRNSTSISVDCGEVDSGGTTESSTG